MVRRWLGSLAAGAGVAILACGPGGAQPVRELFFDPSDGKFDLSGILARGGFVPVPVIITEPAVEGGLGIVGQFIHGSPAEGNVSRTILGAVYTGNGSYGGGLLHSGNLREGQLKFNVGLGAGDVNLPLYPFGGDRKLEYNTKVAGFIANARLRLGQSPVYTGPRLVYRATEVSLTGSGPFADRVDKLVDRLETERRYAALGWSLHFDSRNNPITPTDGVNAILRYDQYSEALGSDGTFGLGRASVHGFRTWENGFTLAGMADYQFLGEDGPFFFAPSVQLRGVSYGRFAGDAALSTEIELRRQISPRWGGVVFAGYGESYVDSARLFEPESGIWTGGAGIRYRIASKLGVDAGLDIARGPEETIVYIQFGHAWMRTMD